MNCNLIPNRTSNQKVEEIHGSVFFNFLIQGTVLSQIVIHCRESISCVIFSEFWPLKIKISGKKLHGQNPPGMLNRIGFKNLKKLNFGLNIGILKLMSKNSVSSTQTATLNI